MSHGLRKHSLLKPNSVLLCQPHDGSRETQQDFTQCVHCGRHWPIGDSIVKISSGELELGFCARCNGVTCPDKKCQACAPIEQQLDNIEAGLRIDHRPTKVAFPKVITA